MIPGVYPPFLRLKTKSPAFSSTNLHLSNPKSRPSTRYKLRIRVIPNLHPSPPNPHLSNQEKLPPQYLKIQGKRTTTTVAENRLGNSLRGASMGKLFTKRCERGWFGRWICACASAPPCPHPAGLLRNSTPPSSHQPSYPPAPRTTHHAPRTNLRPPSLHPNPPSLPPPIPTLPSLNHRHHPQTMTSAPAQRLQALSQHLQPHPHPLPSAGTFENIPKIRRVAGDSVGPYVSLLPPPLNL